MKKPLKNFYERIFDTLINEFFIKELFMKKAKHL